MLCLSFQRVKFVYPCKGDRMKGRIIGPPVPVLVGMSESDMRTPPQARLAVAIETEYHKCVAALLPDDVFPLMGQEVNVKKIDPFCGHPFAFCIVRD